MTKKYLKSREYFEGYLDWEDMTSVEPNENALINVVITYPHEDADTDIVPVCLECLLEADLRAGVTPKGERIRHEPTDCDLVGCDYCQRQPRPKDDGIRKYWVAADRQAEIGAWPKDTPDEQIWEELKDIGHDATGAILTGKWEQ
jgi:hypothetical protein